MSNILSSAEVDTNVNLKGLFTRNVFLAYVHFNPVMKCVLFIVIRKIEKLVHHPFCRLFPPLAQCKVLTVVIKDMGEKTLCVNRLLSVNGPSHRHTSNIDSFFCRNPTATGNKVITNPSTLPLTGAPWTTANQSRSRSTRYRAPYANRVRVRHWTTARRSRLKGTHGAAGVAESSGSMCR